MTANGHEIFWEWKVLTFDCSDGYSINLPKIIELYTSKVNFLVCKLHFNRTDFPYISLALIVSHTHSESTIGQRKCDGQGSLA